MLLFFVLQAHALRLVAVSQQQFVVLMPLP